MNTRTPKIGVETLQSVEQGLTDIFLAMRPNWWLPWGTAQAAMTTLQSAIANNRFNSTRAVYLPLTISKTQERVALQDGRQRIVGTAPVVSHRHTRRHTF